MEDNKFIANITLEEFITKNFIEDEIIDMKKRAVDGLLKELCNIKNE